MGFFQRLKEGLFKTKSGLADKVDELAQNTRVIDDDFYDELTDILIMADVGVAATGDIIEKLKAQVKEKKIKDGNQAKEVFKQIMETLQENGTVTTDFIPTEGKTAKYYRLA